jgi:hypothetical protein
MLDFAFAMFLAVLAFGVGKLILDRLGQSPRSRIDLFALAVPLGMGFLSLGTLAAGEMSCLNRLGLSIVLGFGIELGLVSLLRSARRARTNGVERGPERCRPWRVSASPRSILHRPFPLIAEMMRGRVSRLTPAMRSHFPRLTNGGIDAVGDAPIAASELLMRMILLCTVLIIVSTSLCALAPVTDGDALCYHLQVPKVFLIQESVGFAPDLHETVYPLVTELLYALALEFRGPVACRWIQWLMGLIFAANVIALGRTSLGRYSWLAGAIALAVPAISNGMSAPLNDVALAAFGTAAILAWQRLQERPSVRAVLVAGALGGLAIGVKYPALVLCGLMFLSIALRCTMRARTVGEIPASRWLALAGVYLGAVLLVGGCWYVRAYVHTGNPVFPYFRQYFGNAGLDEVLGPEKRPLTVTLWNLLTALVPLSLEPNRFDSFSHQFGPVFLLFLPALFVERAPRRLLGVVGLAYLYLMLCLTQRQSMRFVLVALGPMSVAVAYLARRWSERKTLPARLLIASLVLALGFEASLAFFRSHRALRVVMGRESPSEYLLRCEPTFHIGRWVADHLSKAARLIGQDHRGFYIPRPYTMELAHRRRTGLGSHGESPGQIIDHLRRSGFTHLLLCPPAPETPVEFDPTLGRLLGPWLARETPLYHKDLRDDGGVLRHYAIYNIAEKRLTAGQAGSMRR